MNIPETITISGVEYQVIVSDKPIFLNNLRAYGEIDYDKKEINIDETLQDKQGQLQTFLHEILHGIVYDRELDFKNDEEETIVDQLAKGLYQVLKDNPGIFIGEKERELIQNITVNMPEATEKVDVHKMMETMNQMKQVANGEV